MIYCRFGQQEISHREFRRLVTPGLLEADEELQNRPDGEAELPQNVRFDGINHFGGPTTQVSCKMCKKNTKAM